MKTQTQNKLVHIWITSIIVITSTSCKSYKKSLEWYEVDRYNGSSIQQKGTGKIEQGESANIVGTITYFGNNKPANNMQILFVTLKGDTIINATSNKDGEFSGSVSSTGFLGTVIVKQVVERYSAQYVEIIPAYKSYQFDIKIPRLHSVDNESEFTPKQEGEIRKALKNKKHAREQQTKNKQ